MIVCSWSYPGPQLFPLSLPHSQLRRPRSVRRKRPVSVSLSWASCGLGPSVEDPGGPKDRIRSLGQKPQLFGKALCPWKFGAGADFCPRITTTSD